MLVRIKPCYTFDSDGIFDNWAKKYVGRSFNVGLDERHGDIRYYPYPKSYSWRYFLQKELIFIKEKK